MNAGHTAHASSHHDDLTGEIEPAFDDCAAERERGVEMTVNADFEGTECETCRTLGVEGSPLLEAPELP
jgi:hypothetical protein